MAWALGPARLPCHPPARPIAHLPARTSRVCPPPRLRLSARTSCVLLAPPGHPLTHLPRYVSPPPPTLPHRCKCVPRLSPQCRCGPPSRPSAQYRCDPHPAPPRPTLPYRCRCVSSGRGRSLRPGRTRRSPGAAPRRGSTSASPSRPPTLQTDVPYSFVRQAHKVQHALQHPPLLPSTEVPSAS